MSLFVVALTVLTVALLLISRFEPVSRQERRWQRPAPATLPRNVRITTSRGA